jgi:dynein intermediate chain
MADAARSARSAALEEKKRRLEELKARRNQRNEVDSTTKAAIRTGASANLDEYIDDLLKAPAAAAPAVEKVEVIIQPEETKLSATDTSKSQSNNVIAEAVPPAPAPLPAKKVETFEISTQTDPIDFPDAQTEEEDAADIAQKPSEANKDQESVAESEQESIVPKILSTEELEETVVSIPFSSFLNTASKKVERVLGAPVLADLLVNFVGETDGIEPTAKPSDGSRQVSAHEIYECPKWTASRDVTDMDWSSLHRELMLSSYHMPSSAASSPFGSAALSAVSPDDTPSASLAPRSGELQSDGLVLIWSLSMPARPEHIFTCGSPVLSSRFHPSESPLILGGCQSGQLVIWDIRAGRLPVQRSDQGHAHPLCCMEVAEGGVSRILNFVLFSVHLILTNIICLQYSLVW